jgi:hypothetical protein
MSMAAGEYVSVQSQADSEEADLALERRELRVHPARELEELTGIYVERGLDRPLAREVAEKLTAHDALAVHARDEVGITDVMQARPLQAAASAASLRPARCRSSRPRSRVTVGPAVVGAATVVTLAILGAVAGWAGGASTPRRSVTLWGMAAMALTAAAEALRSRAMTLVIDSTTVGDPTCFPLGFSALGSPAGAPRRRTPAASPCWSRASTRTARRAPPRARDVADSARRRLGAPHPDQTRGPARRRAVTSRPSSRTASRGALQRHRSLGREPSGPGVSAPARAPGGHPKAHNGCRVPRPLRERGAPLRVGLERRHRNLRGIYLRVVEEARSRSTTWSRSWRAPASR